MPASNSTASWSSSRIDSASTARFELSQGMRRPREALPLAEEAYRLATQDGYAALAQKSKRILDILASAR